MQRVFTITLHTDGKFNSLKSRQIFFIVFAGGLLSMAETLEVTGTHRYIPCWAALRPKLGDTGICTSW